MTTQYLNPNWDLIKKAYQKHDTSELNKELNELHRELKNIFQSCRITELKLLPKGETVLCTRVWVKNYPCREFMKKIKDRRKFMEVERQDGKIWIIPYDELEIPVANELGL